MIAKSKSLLFVLALAGCIVVTSGANWAKHRCGSPCRQCCVVQSCCPCPPPVEMVICLEDPCCCIHEATVCVPACCAGQLPCVTWRKGVCGRQIATLSWDCGHDQKVVITGKGKVKVRG